MKENEFLDGVSNIDSDIVERFVSMDNRLKRKSSKRNIWVRVSALAACLALIASIILSMFSNNVPTWNTAHYSASYISKLFSGSKAAFGGETNAYTTLRIPNDNYLYIGEVPDEKYLPIYKYNGSTKKVSKKELNKFANGFIAKLSKSLGVDPPTYSIEKDTEDEELYASENMGKYSFSLRQDKISNVFLFYNFNGGDNDCDIVLEGETVQIDQRLSDEEILASLESVKNKLFDIFGVSFEDSKICRKFDSSQNRVDHIYVYFYNEDDHPMNSYLENGNRFEPVSDYIEIWFDNSWNYNGDIVSDGILTDASIYYLKNRVNVHAQYPIIANAKRLSLKEAEALLYKGYVFGGHSCPLCMKNQEKISFKNYDYVGLEYVSNPNDMSEIIPFYTFYKKLRLSQQKGYGNYAKTYVPAIEVYGYEEYFKSQAANHR